MQDFDRIIQFLKHVDEPALSGQSAAREPPPAEVTAAIEDFISGRMPEEARGEFYESLKTNPEWIELLLQRIRDTVDVEG